MPSSSKRPEGFAPASLPKKPAAYTEFSPAPSSSDAGAARRSPRRRALDEFEHVPSSARFSPLCQGVLQREHLGAHRHSPARLLPISDHGTFSVALRKDVEFLLANKFCPEALLRIAALSEGKALTGVLARQTTRLTHLGYQPSDLVGIVETFCKQDGVRAATVEERLEAYALAGLTAETFWVINDSDAHDRVLELVEKQSHRIYLINLGPQLLASCSYHPALLAALEAHFADWERLSRVGLDERSIAKGLSLQRIWQAVTEISRQLDARIEHSALEEMSTLTSYDDYIAACDERVDSATSAA